jgi:hypothetical protein
MSEQPPLFVKVDKYHSVISSIKEMKTFVSGTMQLFEVMEELETVRDDAIGIMKVTAKHLEEKLANVDASLLRPFGDVPDPQPQETSLAELQKQLAALKLELAKLK